MDGEIVHGFASNLRTNNEFTRPRIRSFKVCIGIIRKVYLLLEQNSRLLISKSSVQMGIKKAIIRTPQISSLLGPFLLVKVPVYLPICFFSFNFQEISRVV
jgi:hypothetical protein